MILFEEFEAIVKVVSDGDTITVAAGVHLFHIRLAHIDAPEDGQPYCLEAKRALSKMIYGKTVKVKPIGHDRYSRLIAEVRMMDDIDVSAYMIGEGWAWWYDLTKRNEFYGEIEREAREQRVGLWVDKNPEAPWMYRKRKEVTRKR